MGLRQLRPDDPDLPAVHALIQTSFAFMDGVVNPPSSVHVLTLPALQRAALASELWAMGTPPHACAIFTPRPDVLYVGKLCVAAHRRGKGDARTILKEAASRARTLGLSMLEVQVRVELSGNHAAFMAMGFVETGRTAHEGFSRPTSITFRKPV